MKLVRITDTLFVDPEAVESLAATPEATLNIGMKSGVVCVANKNEGQNIFTMFQDALKAINNRPL